MNSADVVEELSAIVQLRGLVAKADFERSMEAQGTIGLFVAGVFRMCRYPVFDDGLLSERVRP